MTRARNIAGFSTITTTPSPVHVGPIGVLTATRIDGEFNKVDLNTRNITAAGIAATNLQVSGITTGLNVSGIITAQNGINFNGTSTGLNVSGVSTLATLTVTGNVSVGGTLTYEDVTNIDSIGIITARKGIVSSGVVTATSFSGSGANLTGIVADKIFEGNTEVETVDTGSDGHVKVTTEGTERLRITSTGKVGISSDAPTSLLTVGPKPNSARSTHPTVLISPTSGNASLMLRGNSPTIDFDSTGSGIAQVCTDNKDLIVSAGTFEDTSLNVGEMVRIKANGLIGIGTDNPSRKLHVGESFIRVDDGYGLDSSGSTEKVILDNGFISFTTASAERVRIESNGRIAVGGFSGATSDLHIKTASSPTVRLQDTTNDCILLSLAQDSNAHVGTFSNHDLIFDTNSTERLRIASNGEIGIGNVSNPDTMLHIFMSSNTAYSATAGVRQGMKIFNDSNVDNGYASIELAATDGDDYYGSTLLSSIATGTNYSNDFAIQTRHAGNYGERLRITSAGVIQCGTSGVLKAEINNSVSGHQFISQCDDNNNGFEVYQKHGTTTTRNTFAVYANTGSSSSKELQFAVRGDGTVIGQSNSGIPLQQILHKSATSQTVANTSETRLTFTEITFTAKQASTTLVYEYVISGELDGARDNSFYRLFYSTDNWNTATNLPLNHTINGGNGNADNGTFNDVGFFYFTNPSGTTATKYALYFRQSIASSTEFNQQGLSSQPGGTTSNYSFFKMIEYPA
ncbi:tail fiber protein [Prochlorococcus phage P-TIM68]|uniref:Uncharacterized protein n=1 Tax=Prochlorococcus phage P-TIM68 TaxID=1542477 RepID=A0A0K0KVR8_9CAUD|nr:tail fiber protein [Prochlorococcus phage P-TIM68]AIR93417.1 hypothetical protein [Prochlorococcus phage P-TIM68]